jgi:hypothetical protein
MKTQTRIGGFQIAFIVLALVFLAYPMEKYIGPLLGIESQSKLVSRLFIFVPLRFCSCSFRVSPL